MHKKGFTLIELLIVVLIIGILAAIALPQYNTSVERSKMAEAVTLVKQIAEANKRYYMATGAYAYTVGELDIEIPGEDYTGAGDIRKQTKNFIYTASVINTSPYLAISYRIPFAQRYYISIYKNNNNIRCTAYAGITDIQQKLCSQLDTNGTI